MYEDIVVPIDLALEATELALGKALRLADVFDSTVHVIHVSLGELSDTGSGSGDSDDFDVLRQYVESEGIEVDIEYCGLNGSVVDEILAYSDGVSADLIVMSTHGRSGVNRLAFGSITSDVIKEASCPVLAMNRSIT